jgi:hypothetical protein
MADQYAKVRPPQRPLKERLRAVAQVFFDVKAGDDQPKRITFKLVRSRASPWL